MRTFRFPPSAFPRCRISWPLPAWAALLVCSGAWRSPVPGQGASDSGCFLEPIGSVVERTTEPIQDELHSVVFTGCVVDQFDRPIDGAVVVSDAGGSAATRADGYFRLHVPSAVDITMIRVTALASVDGSTRNRTILVPYPIPGETDLGSLSLGNSGECQPQWLPAFGGHAGPSYSIASLSVFDDGTGPAVYAGGSFEHAGGQSAKFVAKWDGTSWSAVGSPNALSGYNGVRALATFDDGTGEALYAGGDFYIADQGNGRRNIAKWDGTRWSIVGNGVNNRVLALHVFDDGTGPGLYVGGEFQTAGGLLVNQIAKWDGVQWSSLGTGTSAFVTSLCTYDDGTGPALYVGGGFQVAGGIPAKMVAKWDGASWASLGSGMQGSTPEIDRVNALAVFDDGHGSKLFAAGRFEVAGGQPTSKIAAWDGANWSPLGPGFPAFNDYVYSLATHDDGFGPALYVGGTFKVAGDQPAYGLARWDGSQWDKVGEGFSGSVLSSVEFEHEGTRVLCFGGSIGFAGRQSTRGFALWDGSMWIVHPTGPNNDVNSLAVFDDGSGPALYATGLFNWIAGKAASHFAKWNGSRWSPVQPGFAYGYSTPNTLRVLDDGSGPAMYMGGPFIQAGNVRANGIAKWDGTTWSSLGLGVQGGGVTSLAMFDSGTGPDVIVGGNFPYAGGRPARSIAKWDGVEWSALGAGIGTAFGQGSVYALEVFDDGNGAALYAGGSFTIAGSISANSIAKWNGTEWSALEAGIPGVVNALVVFDDGSGPALFAAGHFRAAGSIAAFNIAKWDGSQWSALPGDFLHPVSDYKIQRLIVFDDGQGPALFAAGQYSLNSVGKIRLLLSKWDGQGWTHFPSRSLEHSNTSIRAVASFDSGTGPRLYVAGNFFASPSGDSYLTAFGCPVTSAGNIYCTPGTSANACVPVISAIGNASASSGSGFPISVSNADGNRPGILFYGVGSAQSQPWTAGSSSTLCILPPMQRMRLQQTGGTDGSCDGLLSEDWNAFIQSSAGSVGYPFLGGERVRVQAWIHDPGAPGDSVVSNGLLFIVEP